MLFAIHSCSTKKADDLIGHRLTSLDNNKLFVEYKGEGDVVQFKMFQGLSQILKKNETGVFEGTMDILRIDDAVFAYSIIVHKKQEDNQMVPLEYTNTNGEQRFIWNGKNRSFNYQSKDPLEGYLSDTIVYSKALEQERTLTIYRPEKVTKSTPIIYMTDGSNVHDFGPYLEDLIDRKLIEPVILMGVHSGNEPMGSGGNTLSSRYFEYVYNDIEREHFNKHEKFFLEEVIELTEESIDNWHGERYIYGVSNGAAFSLYAGLNRPHLFKEIIAYSIYGYIGEFSEPLEFKYASYPKINLATGRYEPNAYRDNRNLYHLLIEQNVDVEMKEIICGHDEIAWKAEFLDYIRSTFSPLQED